MISDLWSGHSPPHLPDTRSHHSPASPLLQRGMAAGGHAVHTSRHSQTSNPSHTAHAPASGAAHSAAESVQHMKEGLEDNMTRDDSARGPE